MLGAFLPLVEVNPVKTNRTGLISMAALALVLFAGCSSQRPTITAPTPAALDPSPDELGVVLLEDLTGRQIFPAADGWNLDASQAPVDPNSQAYIDYISGRTAQDSTAVVEVQAAFGRPPAGIPYVGVSGTQPLVPVTFVDYPLESDAGAPGRPVGYPIPELAKTVPGYVSGNVPGGGTIGDRHVIVVDRDHGLLFETWATRWNPAAGRWEAGSGAIFDLSTGSTRPEGWTSASASGLAIFPGLVRYDEASLPDGIPHAFSLAVRSTNGRVWPASHTGGWTAGAPPIGARLRLKASFDLSGYPPLVQRIFGAMKTHGLIITDNCGSGASVFGTMDARWDPQVIYPAFATLFADDFEVVQLGWGRPSPSAP
jgi:hypothetical protein